MIMSREQLETVIEDDSEISDLIINDEYLEYVIQNEAGAYVRRYYYPETIDRNHIKNHLLMDPKVEKIINKHILLDFLNSEIDKNALSVCEYIAFIYDDDDESPSRKLLQDIYDDEYAMYICEDLLGLTWVERQIIIINVGYLKEVNDEILYNDINDFLIGFLSTIFHEFRHLIYECHELLELGSTYYPVDGGEETAVEEYGNQCAEATYRRYGDLLNKKGNDKKGEL